MKELPKKSKTLEIGEIGNYYGGLNIKEDEGKYYWSIEDYDGYFWEVIPKYLYDALIKFDEDFPVDRVDYDE